MRAPQSSGGELRPEEARPFGEIVCVAGEGGASWRGSAGYRHSGSSVWGSPGSCQPCFAPLCGDTFLKKTRKSSYRNDRKHPDCPPETTWPLGSTLLDCAPIQGISEQSPSSRKDLLCCDQVTWLCRPQGGHPLSSPQGAAPAPATAGAEAQGRQACALCPGGAAVSCRAEPSAEGRGSERSAEGAAGPPLPMLVSAIPEALLVRLQGHTCLSGEG